MITGGKINKVVAEKMKEEPHTGMDVNIKNQDVEFTKTKMTIKYIYQVNYKENIAKMDIHGEMYFEESEKTIAEWKKTWEKDKMLPDEVTSDFVTAATYTASTIGTLLAFAINVNSPINVARAQLKRKEEPEKQKAG